MLPRKKEGAGHPLPSGKKSGFGKEKKNTAHILYQKTFRAVLLCPGQIPLEEAVKGDGRKVFLRAEERSDLTMRW